MLLKIHATDENFIDWGMTYSTLSKNARTIKLNKLVLQVVKFSGILFIYLFILIFYYIINLGEGTLFFTQIISVFSFVGGKYEPSGWLQYLQR